MKGSSCLLLVIPGTSIDYILSRAKGWGLQQTTRAAGSDKTQGQVSFAPFTGGLVTLPKNLKKNGPYSGPVFTIKDRVNLAHHNINVKNPNSILHYHHEKY